MATHSCVFANSNLSGFTAVLLQPFLANVITENTEIEFSVHSVAISSLCVRKTAAAPPWPGVSCRGCRFPVVCRRTAPTGGRRPSRLVARMWGKMCRLLLHQHSRHSAARGNLVAGRACRQVAGRRVPIALHRRQTAQ